MTLVITHAFVSGIADGGDNTLVRPSNWNANHTLTGVASLAQGGTNASSLAASGLLYSDGTSVISAGGTTWDNTNQALTIAGATVTTSNPVLNLSQTWNAGGVTFTALKLNVTNTASAAASKVFDFQIGSTSFLSLSQAGRLVFANTDGSIYSGAGSQLWFDSGGVRSARMVSGVRIDLPTNGTGVVLGWNSAADFSGNNDTYIGREAAGIIQTFNYDSQTSATGLHVYNTTDNRFGAPTNYERGVLDWTTNPNNLTIGCQAAGTGSLRALSLGTGTSSLAMQASANWTFNVAGNVLAYLIGSPKTLDLTNGNFIGFESGQAGTPDVGVARVVANVLEINNGTVGTLTGTYLHWGGQARVTSDVTNSTTSLADATGLSVSLAAGRTYSFEVQISFTDAAAGGIQAAMVAANSLTATNIIYDGWIVDSAANGIKGNTQATALSGVVASATTTGTAGHVTIYGVITVNAAGTLKVQFAQNTSNGTATTVKRGSYMIVHDMP